MIKPFSSLVNKDKDKYAIKDKKTSQEKVGEKSKTLIIFGFLVSLSSIFLLLYTINSKFGWIK